MEIPSLALPAISELAEYRRWVCRDAVKAPLMPSGRPASSTDPTTWSSFADTCQGFVNGTGAGVGFVFVDGDDYAGVDLDGCIDNNGNVEPWAAQIIAGLNSYTEISPSGRGIHILVRGKLPPGGRKKGHVEMYDSARYFTVTGRHFEGTPETIEERSEALGIVHAGVFGDGSGSGTSTGYERIAWDGELPESVMRIAERDEKTRNLLSRPAGEVGYPSGSEADLALASRLAHRNRSGAEIEAALRYRRAHVDVRFKADDYFRRTAGKALGGRVASSADGRGSPLAHRAIEEAKQESVLPEHLTDLGNGRRLASRQGLDLRYCHISKRWLVWDGRVWAADATGEVMRRAKAAVSTIYTEAAKETDADTRKAISAHARRSEGERQIKAMIALAASEPGIPVCPDELDREPMILNVENGVIELRTGELRAHQRADLLTKITPATYDPAVRSPLFEKFLERIIPDAAVRSFLQRAVGYSLTGLTIEQVLILLWGTGANGKTTFIETLMALFGDYGIKTPADTLLARRDTGIPNDVAALRGARLVAAVEMEEGRRLAEVRVKELTGGDTISARFMRGEWFTFRPVCKVWLASNHRPVVRGTDHAIWRRLRLIPFTETISETERDAHLIEKLRGELTGVLTWAVEGCLAWQQEGLGAPDSVLVATQEYRQEQDILGEFLLDRCELDHLSWVSASDLYRAYCEWSEGERRPMSKREIGLRLRERGFDDTRKGRGRARAWLGIRLSEAPSRDGDHGDG